MTSKDKNYLFRCFRWMSNELVRQYLNNSLPLSVTKILEKFYDSISTRLNDWSSLSKDTMLELGFIRYEGAKTIVWLIPLWMYPIIPENVLLTTPDGSNFIFNSKTASTNTIFNCLTYGIKEMETDKIEEEY